MKIKTTFYFCLAIVLISSINIFSQAPVITKQPSNQGVIEGQTATFSIEVTGDTLTYQWYKNDTLIVGATDSMYTTPATVVADNGSKFSIKVTNSHGSDSSSAATLYVTASGSRVTAGLQVLYNFNEAGGDSVHDVSGVGSPLSLGIDNPSNVTWTPNGLGIIDMAYINADPPATKVISAVKSSNEITVEVWILPAVSNQIDGAGIFTIGKDFNNADFSIIQLVGNKFSFRFRTTTTDNRGTPSFTSTVGSVPQGLTHIIFTKTSDGVRTIYINGIKDTSSILSGDFSNWDPSYLLQIGKQWGSERNYLGVFYLASIYDRALSNNEVQENYNVGVNIDHNPQIIIEPKDLGLLSGQSATFSVSAVGDGPLTYQWRKNGVDIPGADSASYNNPSVSLGNNGEQYSVIVGDTLGSDTSRSATLFVTDVNQRVTSGQILLYEFQEGIGDTIKDVSGSGSPLDLKIANQNAVMWKPYGLIVDSVANIVSTTSAAKITNSVIASGAFTFEAWVKPENLTQSPATIFSIANGSNPLSLRNFNMNQISNDVQSYLRTSKTSDAGSELSTSSGLLSDSLIHIVYTHNTKEVSRIFINGVEVSKAPYFTGDLSNWNVVYSLALANQFSANQPWKGVFNLVSFYDRALDSSEIVHNYEYGPIGNVAINAPGNLALDTPKPGQVNLTWADSSDNEDGFIIERKELSPNPSAFIVIDTVSANDTTYSDSGLPDTTTYTYRVQAYNLVAKSPYSNEETIKTLLSTIDAPTNLIAVLNVPDTNKVDLNWTDNSTNELGFIIQRKLGDTASVELFTTVDTVGADIVTYTDTTVSDTTTYTYRIYAYNSDTVSQYSNLAQISTPIPVELTSLTISSEGGKVHLLWETATELNNAGFSIERSKDNISFSEIAFIKGNGTTTDKSSYSYADNLTLAGKYYYRLKQVDLDGSFHYLKTVEINIEAPKEFSLYQNYPNPFNPSTTIRFALPTNAKVNIKLYNTLGQQTAVILNSELDAGVHETVFNASNLSSGVYFYRIEAKGNNGSVFTATKRLLILK